MGPIIPPSIGMIVFAHVAGNVSIAALFLAGVVPGVLIGVSLMAASFVHGKLYHQKTLPKLSRREKIRRVFDGMAGVFTMVIILGGIISGVFTATEAGAAASRLRADPHGLRLQGDQDVRTAGDPLGMLPDQRRRHDADRDLLGVLAGSSPTRTCRPCWPRISST